MPACMSMSIGVSRPRISRFAAGRCCASSITARARRKMRRYSGARGRYRQSAAPSCRWTGTGSSGSAASPRIARLRPLVASHIGPAARRELHRVSRADPAGCRPLPSFPDLRRRTDQPDPPRVARGAARHDVSRVSRDLQRERPYGAPLRQFLVPHRQPGALSPMFSGALARGFLCAQAVAAEPSRRDRRLHLPEPLYARPLRRLGLARDKLFHVTNGQRDYATADDQPVQARQEARETYNRFGFFGQIIDAKGVHIILRAVALLRAEGFTDFTVEINGDNINYASPEVRAEIEEFIEAEKQRPPGERLVWFNGSYATRELRSRMARIDWCLVPSMWWEAFALVISEAWMFKKPVICSNIGAMADRVRDEKDGLQFEMGDPAGLARTIKRAASEPGLWKRLAGALPVPPARADMVDW